MGLRNEARKFLDTVASNSFPFGDNLHDRQQYDQFKKACEQNAEWLQGKYERSKEKLKGVEREIKELHER